VLISMVDSDPTGAAQVGVVGLAVMGSNLARNFASHGRTVALFNRTQARTDALVAAHGAEGSFVPSASVEDFVASLERPRRILLMVKAGPATDAAIDTLTPHLEPGDIVVDGGNAHYEDTRRREAGLREHGLHFVGAGISGGEEGALRGPSIMPGGSRESYAALGPLLEEIAGTGRPFVDMVADAAEQKGTGRWTVQTALELGVPTNAIAEAVFARSASGHTRLRAAARSALSGPTGGSADDPKQLIEDVRAALWASKVVAYAQGLDELRAASEAYDWGIDVAAVARIWRAGCIIRARLLERIRKAYAGGDLPSLLAEPDVARELGQSQDGWRRAVTLAATSGSRFPASARRWPTTTPSAASGCRRRWCRGCETSSGPTPTGAWTEMGSSTRSGPRTGANRRSEGHCRIRAW
jgi:6-phosphogluconate dehydrogenase